MQRSAFGRIETAYTYRAHIMHFIGGVNLFGVFKIREFNAFAVNQDVTGADIAVNPAKGMEDGERYNNDMSEIGTSEGRLTYPGTRA